MVHLLQCRCRSVHILFFFFFFSILLLLASSMEVEVAASSDASRRMPLRQPLEEPTGTPTGNKVVAAAGTTGGSKQEVKKLARALIGSRPPRCERACMSCGHCEAVQVPIVPQIKTASATDRVPASAAAADEVTLSAALFSYSNRVDSITNYKPLSWKCRCGGTILDP